MNAEEQTDFDNVRAATERLAESFDTVQIFVSRNENGKTRTVSYGTGNWYARVGQTREFLLRDDEQTRVDVKEDNVQ